MFKFICLCGNAILRIRGFKGVKTIISGPVLVIFAVVFVHKKGLNQKGI